MNRRDIVIGIIVLILIGLLVFVWNRRRSENDQVLLPSPTPTVEEELEDRFRFEIPADSERVTLRDVAGGNSTAIATRKLEDSVFTHVVLADLPDPQSGYFYEGWLVRGEEGDKNFAYISTGRLRAAKGGYLLEFTTRQDLSEYTTVVITEERVDDGRPERHILEGSFQ